MLLIVVHLDSPSFAQPRCEAWAAKALSVEGKVERLRAGETRWKTLVRNEILCAGDSARVAKRGRAAIFLPNQTLLRLDEATTVTFTKVEPDKPSWLDLLKGAIHFISRTPASLGVTTPFVNAGIEGTEFVVRVEPSQTGICVFEGQVLARNALGKLMLGSGEAAVTKKGRAPERRLVVKPREAVQWALYYPPLIDMRRKAYPAGPEREVIQAALERYRRGDLLGAFAHLDQVSANRRTPRYYVLRAGLLLTVGRVDEAEADIATALKLNPHEIAPYALRSVIAVTQNDNEKAFELAQKAVALDPRSPTAQVALSYTYQARFDIEKARDSVEQAVKLDPANALAWARLAELELSLGYLDKAQAASQRATELDSQLGRTQAVLGFANLTRVDIEAAKVAFDKAIALEPAFPLARLGLGLAMIRQGHLNKGTREIETAAILDPDNSLIRSYLGKAYFEQNRNGLARAEFAMAKELDPKDPTPWFYDAILKQTSNRPVEALHDLQKSIALNDNRAVYRSRLLLDQDQATRGTSLARIYDDLGFDEVALAQASKSLSLDPANHSAHRFLADTYARLPRHEIARVSELLQAQLLQPKNISPVQPQLSVTDLNVITDFGATEATFNEFTSLFERNRPQIFATGQIGNEDSIGDELVLSGNYNKVSYSVGQFYLETDGFRENNDIQHNIYDLLAQVAITPNLNIQAEFRTRETSYGDLGFFFEQDKYDPLYSDSIDHDIERLGVNYSISPPSNFLMSFIHSNRKESVLSSLNSVRSHRKQDGDQVEAQYLHRLDHSNYVVGFLSYGFDAETRVESDLTNLLLLNTNGSVKQETAYVYANINTPKSVIWTIGFSYDSYDDNDINIDLNKLNSKIGLRWFLSDHLQARVGYYEGLKRRLIANQTLEPTQIAGFNQFFDDFDGSTSRQFGIGIDEELSQNLNIGFEVSKRILDTRLALIDGGTITDSINEHYYNTYLYWTPHPSWTINTQFVFDDYKNNDSSLVDDPVDLETLKILGGIRFFNEKGFLGKLETSYVNQNVRRRNAIHTLDEGTIAGPILEKDTSFFVVDTVMGYRLPRRIGLLAIEVRNLFDNNFNFQSDNFRTSELRGPSYIPDRNILFRITLNL